MKAFDVEGTILTHTADLKTGGAARGAWLTTARGRTYEIRLSRQQKIKPGSRIAATLTQPESAAEARVENYEVLSGPDDLSNVVSPTDGEQPVLAFNINHCSDPAYIEKIVFADEHGSMDHYYRTTSRGKLSTPGKVIDVSIQLPSTYDPPAIAARCVEAALAQGENLEIYQHHLYIGWFGYPWAGLGAHGFGTRSPGGTIWYHSAWLDGGPGPAIHETGHCWMAHATGFNPYSEYGDPTDVMGTGGRHELNAPHRWQMQWENVNLLDVAEAGMYEIAPLEIDTVKNQILRVAKPDTGEWFYLSYRQPVSEYDDYFYVGLTQGAHVHIWSPPDVPWESNITKFVDTNPSSEVRFLDAPLHDGGIWAQSGVVFKQWNHAPGVTGSVVVEVSFGQAPPVPPPVPPLSVSPQSVSLRRNEQQQFSANQPGVQWLLNGEGSLSDVGLYTAPPLVSRKTSARVIARSGSAEASAVVTLMKGGWGR